MTVQRYQRASFFRSALEERVNRMAREKGSDPMRIRRKVAFDRFLFRLLQLREDWLVVKGGYALELRMERARATKDIDLSIRNHFSLDSERSNPRSEQIRQKLQEAMTSSLDDFFVFTVGQAVLNLENAPYGGYRFPVEAKLAGRVFIKFDVDVAFGDVWLAPHEKIVAADWLGFAGFAPPEIPLISKEQQFAEKLHAYTLPRERTNSRVKDLVDMVLILETGALDTEIVVAALRQTFDRRGTHPLPTLIPDPPEIWKRPFEVMIHELGYNVSLREAVEKVRGYWETLGF